MWNLFRIIDANFNRAREALRIVEDCFRFSYVNPQLFKKIRSLRHTLSQNFYYFYDKNKLIVHRNTESDIGRPEKESLPGKYKNEIELILANLNRFSEAIRCIEEYSRVILPKSSREFSKMRFEGYSLQKEIFEFLSHKKKVANALLYVLLAPEYCKNDLLKTAKLVVENGADIVQLRFKKSNDRELLYIARRINSIAKANGVLFIVNDRVDIAMLSDADGVHLGSSDIKIIDARNILGSSKIIGATSHNLKELKEAEKNGADYSSIGPVFPTEIKPKLKPFRLSSIKKLFSSVDFPIFAIGGINAQNVQSLAAKGIRRICVCRGIISSDNPARQTRILKSMIEGIK